jgi:mannose-6-phosphate isomerase-like protein (cupin superfamily)
MKIIRFKDLKFVPASHEDPKNPAVVKKVLLTVNDLSKARIQMINWCKLPPKKTFTPHLHESMKEIYIILSGKAKIKIGNQKAILKKGDLVIIPEGKTHFMTNISPKNVEYLAMGITWGLTGKTIIKK